VSVALPGDILRNRASSDHVDAIAPSSRADLIWRLNMASSPTRHDHTPEEERAIREATLDRTIENSFPASDPPSTNPNPDDHAALGAADKPADIVKRMFAAFSAADLDALLETVHPDSRWTYHGANPRLTSAQFSGHANVRRFFAGILERLEITAFNTDEFVAQGDVVVIFGSESGTVKATGQPFRNEWAQKYVVRDRLIVEMSEYNVQVEPRG
jgi:ketosteroid isomerase-like protein